MNKYELEFLDEEDSHKTAILSQIMLVAGILFSFIVLKVVNHFYEGFFVYEHFGSMESLQNIKRFWPLFVYAFFVTFLSIPQIRYIKKSYDDDEKNLFLGLLSGNLAGIFEEIGYRWIFIGNCMIGICFLNWVMGTIFAWLIVIILALATLGMLAQM
ncbi:MAG: hypothetical protein ACOCWG_03340, partial [bacterium]